jgi:hypothetical protein
MIRIAFPAAGQAARAHTAGMFHDGVRMKTLTPREAALLLATLALALLAALAPPMAQPAYYTHFADARAWLGIPNGFDVLSNLGFALAGAWGLRVLAHAPLRGTPRALAALAFAGLLATAAASAWFHWQPDTAGLAVDRLGMTLAFAGVLGLGVAGHVGARAGALFALLVLLCGPLTIGLWVHSGNLLPWAVLQGGGMALLLVLAVLRPLPGALVVRWGWLIGIYVVAKACELADATLYSASGHWLSGHTLKHLVAALAAWPVISALRTLGQNAREQE